MDLHEWELLDGIDNGDGDGDGEAFLEVNYQGRGIGDGGTNSIYSHCSSSLAIAPPCSTTATLVHMNYFICPPSPSHGTSSDQFIQKGSRHLLPLPLPVPIHFESPPPTATALDLNPNLDSTTCTTIIPNHPLPSENNLKSLPTDADLNPDLDTVSQVFFKKKMKDADQFVDMIKVESSHTRTILSPTVEEDANFHLPYHQFDEAKGDPDPEVGDLEYRRNIELVGGDGEGEGIGGVLGKLKILKWSLSGMAAVAATVCMIVLSNGERKHHRHHQINFRFQICANYDDKHRRMKARRRRRMEQQQQQHLNGAIATSTTSSSGGITGNARNPLGSLSRYRYSPARITVGGYYCEPA